MRGFDETTCQDIEVAACSVGDGTSVDVMHVFWANPGYVAKAVSGISSKS
jgi:hypothetical protein